MRRWAGIAGFCKLVSEKCCRDNNGYYGGNLSTRCEKGVKSLKVAFSAPNTKAID